MQIAKYSIAGGAFLLILLLESLFPLFIGRKDRVVHGLKNFFHVAINNIVVFALFSWIITYIFQIIDRYQLGLFHLVQLPFWLRATATLILFDMWMYIWHRLNHHVSLLWRFHRMHHSDPAMDVTSALRFHVGEIIISTALRLIIFAVLGMGAFELLLYETIMLPVIFFHHSNYFFPHRFDRLLRTVIPTPWMHWIHHSRVMKETNSNYGSVLSWWDRLFGTFRLRKVPTEIEYGIDFYSDESFQTIGGMFITPFTSPKPRV